MLDRNSKILECNSNESTTEIIYSPREQTVDSVKMRRKNVERNNPMGILKPPTYR